MDVEKITEYTDIATRAILESLEPNVNEQGEYTKQACHFNQADAEFFDVIKAIANGMNLSIVRMSPSLGIVLLANDDRGPFAPNLSWLSSHLAKSTKDNRVELQCTSIMALLSLLTEAFPNPQTTYLDWSSPAQFTHKEVLEKMHRIANDVINNMNESENQDTLLSVATVIHENRIPKESKNSHEDTKRVSVQRSQSEMITGWIRLLEEYGLLIKDQGYEEEDVRWMASEKLKVYIGQAGTLPLVETVLAIQSNNQPLDEDE